MEWWEARVVRRRVRITRNDLRCNSNKSLSPFASPAKRLLRIISINRRRFSESSHYLNNSLKNFENSGRLALSFPPYPRIKSRSIKSLREVSLDHSISLWILSVGKSIQTHNPVVSSQVTQIKVSTLRDTAEYL